MLRTFSVAGAGEDERIVGGAVEFDGGHFAGLREGIADGAVNLRRAAEAVGVLHARIFDGVAMRFADLAAFVEMGEVARGHGGAGVGAGVHDARIEGAGAAAERVERKSGGDVGGVGGDVGVAQARG